MKQLFIILPFLSGCFASSHKFATIGDTDFYTVKSPSLLGPSINMVVVMRTNEITPTIHNGFAGNGVAGATVSAAGFIGGAAVLGQSFKPNSPESIVNVETKTPEFIGPLAPPTTIGNSRNDRPFIHRGK